MSFKRQEAFRFSFGEPIDAYFYVILDGQNRTEQHKKYTCKVLDISPRGMKILTDINFKTLAHLNFSIEIEFVIDTTAIRALAKVVWTKPYGLQYQYGIGFEEGTVDEVVIVEELKTMRRKEVSQKS